MLFRSQSSPRRQAWLEYSAVTLQGGSTCKHICLLGLYIKASAMSRQGVMYEMGVMEVVGDCIKSIDRVPKVLIQIQTSPV